MSYTI